MKKFKFLKYFCREHLQKLDYSIPAPSVNNPDNNPSNQSLIEFINNHHNHIRCHIPENFNIEKFGTRLIDLDNARKSRNRRSFEHTRKLLVAQTHDFHQPELMESVNKIIYKSNGEIFNAKYKAITITTKKKLNVDKFGKMLDKYLNSKCYKSFTYCIEHINTNMHAHIALNFSAKKLRPNVLLTSIRKKFDPEFFDVSLKDSNGHCHLRSKTPDQIYGWINYIYKDEPDKIIKNRGALNLPEKIIEG